VALPAFSGDAVRPGEACLRMQGDGARQPSPGFSLPAPLPSSQACGLARPWAASLFDGARKWRPSICYVRKDHAPSHDPLEQGPLRFPTRPITALPSAVNGATTPDAACELVSSLGRRVEAGSVRPLPHRTRGAPIGPRKGMPDERTAGPAEAPHRRGDVGTRCPGSHLQRTAFATTLHVVVEARPVNSCPDSDGPMSPAKSSVPPFRSGRPFALEELRRGFVPAGRRSFLDVVDRQRKKSLPGVRGPLPCAARRDQHQRLNPPMRRALAPLRLTGSHRWSPMVTAC